MLIFIEIIFASYYNIMIFKFELNVRTHLTYVHIKLNVHTLNLFLVQTFLLQTYIFIFEAIYICIFRS